ncbi:MAG: hypothetical protein AB4911_08830 [Oscillochloridaceae bacterium umkhey_bin13]
MEQQALGGAFDAISPPVGNQVNDTALNQGTDPLAELGAGGQRIGKLAWLNQ